MNRYFDHAAATPPFPEALRRFEEVSASAFANPSASHADGQAARRVLDEARKRLLALAGLPAGSLVACSGATEATDLVLRGRLDAGPDGRILLAADVHASAWAVKDQVPDRVDVLETGPDGRVRPGALAARLTKRHVLVSLVHANHETGIVQDLAALVAAARGVPVHADVVQSLGRIPLDLAAAGVAYATFSGHKFGAPRGVGGVLVAPGAPPLRARVPGGGQERGLRGGTENVAGLAAAALALELSLRADPDALRALARTLTERLRSAIPDAVFNSDPVRGLPGFVNLCLPGLVGETLAAELSLRGFSCSAGSACGSGMMLPSRVVLAMGRPKDLALGTLRLTLGRGTAAPDVEALADAVVQVVAKQRALA